MSRTKDFGNGVRHLVRGFTFLAGHPRLWLWAVLPTIINLAILGVMLSVFIHCYGDIYGWLSAHLGHMRIENPTAWYWHVANALLWVVNLLFQLLVVIASLIILLIASYGVGIIVASPFNDALSERTEVLSSGVPPPPFAIGKFMRDIARLVWIESIKALILISIPVALFVLHLIPVVGGPLYIALTFIFGAWSLGFIYADLPMSRRVSPLKERWAFARKNRWALIGLGTGFVIPFFGLLFAAPMVVGGTLLHVDITEHQGS
ncbi:MAG: EI24 domain-containing protein [Pseudomonadota bacterium]